jgi:hypothetical protein
MKSRLGFAIILTLAFALVAYVNAQQQQQQAPDCPMHQKHQGEKSKAESRPDDSHSGGHAEMNERGREAMGFSQSKTTHHFRLARDGGSIEVEVNDPKDRESRDQIRQHLARIAQLFAAGDFETPRFVHSQTPPGVPVMKRLKAEIKYEFEETERGGRLRIRTANAEALAAIHQFLRFQIEDHRTGDPLVVG